MKPAVAACTLLCAATPALADSSAIYVDEVSVIGGPDAAQARAYATSLAQRAGLLATFADASATPCGDDPSCLATRARSHSAAVGIRLTIADIAGRIVVSMVASSGTTTRREIAEDVDLSQPTSQLAVVLRELAPSPHVAGHHGIARWALLGATAGLVAGGIASTLHAYALRDDFLSAHVDENGDVYGISPPEARAAESTARQWSLAGGLMLGAAAITGLTSGILFVKELQ